MLGTMARVTFIRQAPGHIRAKVLRFLHHI
jgi:hypothetical protein